MFLVFEGSKNYTRAINVQDITGVRADSESESVIEYTTGNSRAFHATPEPLEVVVKRINKALYDLGSRSLAMSAQVATAKDW